MPDATKERTLTEAASEGVVFDQAEREPEALVESIRWFIQVPDAVYLDRRLSDGDKMVYMALRRYAWSQGRCWPGQDGIGAELGKSRRQVIRHLQNLRSCGYIEWRRRGMGQTNLYVLLHVTPTAHQAGSADTVMCHTGHISSDVGGTSSVTPVSQEVDSRDVDSREVDSEKKRPENAQRTPTSPEATGDLFSGEQGKQAVSRPRKHGASKHGAGGVKQLTWLQELNEDHRAKCGGDFANWAVAGEALKPLLAELGPAELRRRWRYYLAQTEIRFVSAKQFATKLNAFIPPATWQPGTPVPNSSPTGALHGTHPDVIPAGVDRYAGAEARQRRQEARDGHQ